MKALLFFLTVLPLAARPTLDEALDLDPGEPPLAARFLPRPAHITEDNAFDYEYGHAVAVSGDTAFVSAPVQADFGADKPGEVFVYRRSGDEWSLVQTLRPTEVTGWMRFGESLDVSPDGSILVIGSNDEQQDDPATAVASGAYVYLRHPITGRYEFHQKLVPAGIAPDQWTGPAVAISGDWVLFGSLKNNELANTYPNGAAYFFKREASGLWGEKQKVLPIDTNTQAYFGASVAMEGPHACIAAQRGNLSGRDSGVLYFYRLDPLTDSWIREAMFDEPNGSATYGHNFGRSMAFSGPRLLASYDYSENDFGHTFPIERVGDSWQQQATITSFPGNPASIHKTTSSYSGRVLSQSGDLFACSGNPDGGSTMTLGELLRFEGGGWHSKFTFGPIVAQAEPPSGFAAPVFSDPLNHLARVESIDTDGSSIIFKFEAELDLTTSYSPLVAVISAESREVLPRVGPLINYDDADPNAPQDAAFAFLHLLYEESSPGQFINRHGDMGTLYSPAHRARADEAEALARFAYPSATGSTARGLEMNLLDLAYGRAAAQLILSKNAVVDLDEDRLLDNSGHFIDSEISVLQSALDDAGAGLNVYLELLQDPLGVPPISGNPAGRVLFARHVPGRALVSPIDSTELLPGYKDLVLIHDLLLQYAETASDLAYLLTCRDAPGDADTVRDLIGGSQRLVFEQRNLIDSLFDPAALAPSLRDSLGLDQLSGAIDTALSDLSAFQQNLNGTINILGYEPDFLMLIRSQGGQFDSYDNFEAILNGATGPLTLARDRLTQAITAINNYGNTQDALEAEFSLLVENSTSAIIPRLTEIVGVPYTHPPTPNYQNPQDNEGSEIWQQVRSIEVARQRILHNNAEISNLGKKVEYERQRRRKEAGINAQLQDAIIDFGNRQASMTEEIGRIEAAQQAMNAISEMVEPEKLTKLVLGVGVVNAVVQAGSELGKADLQASKEKLAATQEARIRQADDEILANNSDALVKTMLLEMNTLLIDSQEAAILLRQEAGRLTSLIGEKADLERRLQAVDGQLANRWFADPTHRLRALNATERAHIAFRNARKWLFFAARANEYKWNTPFNLPLNDSPNGRAWQTADLFKLRNAEELKDFFDGLAHWETIVGIGRAAQDKDDWFSLREDYFGYDQLDDTTNAPLFYDVENPATGRIENVDAITAFRYELKRSLEDFDNNGADDITLHFDTLRQTGYDTAANGGLGGYQSTFFNPDFYLDRLDSLRIFIRGPHQNLATGNDGANTLLGDLGYLGTSVIRNEVPGQPLGVSRPDRVVGEFTSFPNRFYRFVTRPLGSPLPSGWSFSEGLTASSVEVLKILPDRSRFSLEGVSVPDKVLDFSERSVATSSWILVLHPSNGVNPGTRLVIDEIDDIELYIEHRAVPR
ncbi:hypothetical protein [Haloferula sargassicola]